MKEVASGRGATRPLFGVLRAEDVGGVCQLADAVAEALAEHSQTYPSRVTPITLRSVLPEGLDPTSCKLHCAVWNGKNHPIDVLAGSWEEWTNWNRWRGTRNDFNRPLIFSMARDRSDPSLWLFGGVFEVLARRDIPHDYSYDVSLREDLMVSFIKRLVMRFPVPGRAIRLNMESHLDQFSVHSVLYAEYAGEAFPGHDQINHTLAELAVVTSQDRLDWRIALQHMEGVYVLHDRLTGEPYVGAAYGDTGIWERLCQYTRTLHGGNVGLAALVAEQGEDYVRANPTFALLEFWSMRTEDQHVIDRETYWKQVLVSRTLGLNRN